MKCKVKIMKGSNLFSLCTHKEWPEVRKYLSSDVAEKEKNKIIQIHHSEDGSCLHLACCHGAPDDIIKAMLDIGGMELVVKIDLYDRIALHFACIEGASYNIIRMLIEVGGKDLVMAKDDNGDTALHHLCLYIEEHTKVYEKIKLILQAGDDTLLLSAKNIVGNTPLEIATEVGASNIIKKLLAVQQMMKKEEGEAARTRELLEESNRRAADLKAYKQPRGSRGE
jgi:ankyrin repeat protein